MEEFNPHQEEPAPRPERREGQRFARPSIKAALLAVGVALTPVESSAQGPSTDSTFEEHLEELENRRVFSFEAIAPLFKKYGLAHLDTAEEWNATDVKGVAFTELAAAINESVKVEIKAMNDSVATTQMLQEQFGSEVAQVHRENVEELAAMSLKEINDDLTALQVVVVNTPYEDAVEALVGEEGIFMQDFGPMTSALKQLQDYARERGWHDETEL